MPIKKVIVMGVWFVFLLNSSVFAAPQKKLKPKATKKIEKNVSNIKKSTKKEKVSNSPVSKKENEPPTTSNKKAPSKFVQKTSPILEIVPQGSIPVGYLAQVYKGGGGFRLGFHFKFPLKKQLKVPIEIRGGFQWGMGFYPSYRGLVIGSPMYPELTILFPLGVASPYLRIGGGMMISAYLPSEEIKSAYSSASIAELKKASVDGLFVFTFGSYFNPPTAKSISILLEMQFLTSVENRVGMFINIGFGIAYHFDGNAWN